MFSEAEKKAPEAQMEAAGSGTSQRTDLKSRLRAILSRKTRFEPAWHAAELKKAKNRITRIRMAKIAKAQIGDVFSTEGIFMGQCTPKDRDGISLGITFNIFAAPQDLTDKNSNKITLTFNNTVKRMSELKDWHGHDGVGYENDETLYKAIKDGSYKGQWIIPTQEILKGCDIDNSSVQANNLYDCKEQGAFKDTFTTAAASSGSDFPQWYWSCTERRDYPSSVWNADFSDGNEGWDHKDELRLSCRPVRLVPVSDLKVQPS